MFGHPKVGSTKFQRICQHPNIDNVVEKNPDLMLPTAIAGVALNCGVKLIEDKTIWPGSNKTVTDRAVYEAAIFSLYRVRRAYVLIDDIPEFVGVENVDPDDARDIVAEAFKAAVEFIIGIYVEYTGETDAAARKAFVAGATTYLSDDDGVGNFALALDRLSGKPISLDLRKAVSQMVSHGLIERTLIPGAVEGVAQAIKLEFQQLPTLTAAPTAKGKPTAATAKVIDWPTELRALERVGVYAPPSPTVRNAFIGPVPKPPVD